MHIISEKSKCIDRSTRRERERERERERTGIISYVFEFIPGHCFKFRAIYLPLSIVNYGVSKHYAGSMVSDRCSLGYLFSEGVC